MIAKALISGEHLALVQCDVFGSGQPAGDTLHSWPQRTRGAIEHRVRLDHGFPPLLPLALAQISKVDFLAVERAITVRHIFLDLKTIGHVLIVGAALPCDLSGSTGHEPEALLMIRGNVIASGGLT